MRRQPLWLRKSPAQLVAQWIARKFPSQWAETPQQRNDLVQALCVELVREAALRMPNASMGDKILDAINAR